MDNAWGIVKSVLSRLMQLPASGEDPAMPLCKYLMLKDPNKPLLNFYEVPADAFEYEVRCLCIKCKPVLSVRACVRTFFLCMFFDRLLVCCLGSTGACSCVHACACECVLVCDVLANECLFRTSSDVCELTCVRVCVCVCWTG